MKLARQLSKITEGVVKIGGGSARGEHFKFEHRSFRWDALFEGPRLSNELLEEVTGVVELLPRSLDI